MFITLVLTILSFPAFAEKITVYGDESYAPVIYQEGKNIKGVLPEVFKHVSKISGDEYDIVLQPWKRAYRNALNGHGGITNISWNSERDKLFDFSLPIYNDDIQLVVLKGKEFPFKKMADLKDKRAGGSFGASYGDEIDKLIEAKVINVERDTGQKSRMLKLLYGRIDVAILGNGKAGLEAVIESDPTLLKNREKFVTLPQPFVTDPLFLAFSKMQGKAAVLERFNKALTEFKKTKEYKKIVRN